MDRWRSGVVLACCALLLAFATARAGPTASSETAREAEAPIAASDHARLLGVVEGGRLRARGVAASPRGVTPGRAGPPAPASP